MEQATMIRRGLAVGFVAVLSLVLAACMLTPGRFTSSLDIRRDGRFSFAYAGEIQLLALSRLAEMGREANTTFKPESCTTQATGAVRPCTPREIAEQKQKWQESRSAADSKRRSEGESMKAMLGGIDPSDPRAAEDLAARLRQQAGWRRVTYKGDGLFEVDFAISGQLDHDFAFPTIERFPMANAFVQLSVRGDGTVRMDAPGFASAMSGEPWRQMMAASAAEKQGRDAPPSLPVVDGSFTVTTDTTILANNTDQGPQADTAGQRLAWTVNARTQAAPMALLRLSR